MSRNEVTVPVATLSTPRLLCITTSRMISARSSISHMIALFLALAKEDDVTAVVGEPAEPVGAITVMGVVGAIEKCRSQDSKVFRAIAFEHHLAGQVHDAVKRVGLGWRCFSQRRLVIGVNRRRN